jgi:flagellin-like hook-associated protein FlgL
VANGDLQSHVSDAKDAEVTLEASRTRRSMMMAAAATLSLAQINVAPQAIASDGVKSFSDPLLAYAFDYPV